MFQTILDKLFQGLPNVFHIVDDILIAWFNKVGGNHDAAFDIVLRICRQANLKLNKDKCLFQCTMIPFFGEVILQTGVSLDPRKHRY